MLFGIQIETLVFISNMTSVPFKNSSIKIKRSIKAQCLLPLCLDRSVFGLHNMGPRAEDIFQGFVAAIKCGLTKRQLDPSAGIYRGSAHVSIPFSTLFYKSVVST